MARPARDGVSAAELPMQCLRDPFAWREALTPTGPSPANSARGSRQVTPAASTHGSQAGSGGGTPICTPPRSPIVTPASASGDLVASMRGNVSGRATDAEISQSNHVLGGSPKHTDLSARSIRSHRSAFSSRDRDMTSARSTHSVENLAYVTPNSTGRISDFASVYETSNSSSARLVDFDSMYDERPSASSNGWGYPAAGEVRRGNVRSSTYASALQEFCPTSVQASGTGSSRGADSGPASSSGYPSAPRTSAGLSLPIAAAAGFRSPAAPSSALSVPDAADNVKPAPKVGLDVKSVFSMARHGKHQDVEASLKAGFDPCVTDNFGNTLFHVACQNGNKRIAKLAAKYGCDMDTLNGKGNTGLHFLFAYGYPDVAEYFISKGAKEHLTNETGKTAREGIR